MSGFGWFTAALFIGGFTVCIAAMIVWLITMVRERPVRYSRRVCWIAALVAVAGLLLNALR